MATTSKKQTSKTTSASNGTPSLDSLSKLLEGLRLHGIDVGALVDWQRRDLDALAEANRQAYEGAKALVERRDEILRETFEQWQEALKNAGGKEPLAGQADAVKRGVQQAIDHIRELSEMEAQSRTQAWKVVQDRMQENVASLQSLLQPK